MTVGSSIRPQLILHRRLASHQFNRHNYKPLSAIHPHSHLPIFFLMFNYYPSLPSVPLSQLLTTIVSNN